MGRISQHAQKPRPEALESATYQKPFRTHNVCIDQGYAEKSATAMTRDTTPDMCVATAVEHHPAAASPDDAHHSRRTRHPTQTESQRI